jgi:molybdopterin synthase sulfur carrier subunit
MANVFIPPQLQSLCEGHRSIELSGRTVGELITALENRFPALAAKLSVDGELKPGLAVTVDNDVSGLGTAQQVSDASEVHFLPAIGGG